MLQFIFIYILVSSISPSQLNVDAKKVKVWSCEPYNSITGLQGVCTNFLAGKYVNVSNRAEVINFEKKWTKTDTEIDNIVEYMNIGKHDLLSLRQLLSNYITIFLEINISLPPLDEFKKIVDGLTKPSFRGCRRSIKRIFCKTAFNLCGVTKENCVKKCENMKQKHCKEQLTAIDLIVKLRPHNQNQFTCQELCQRRV